jgi:preprotein translocase subunit YajC
MGGAAIIIWILVFFGIFYFLAVRPQRRQRQAHAEMVSMLKKGDEVITIGGLYGTVTGLGDDWVELEIAKRTRVRFLKRAISQITVATEDEEDEYIEATEEPEELEAEYAEEPAGEVVDDTIDETPAEPATDDETPAAPEPPEAPKA